MFEFNERPVAEYALAAFLAIAGLGGLVGAQQSLQYIGVGSAIANAIGGVLLLAIAGGFVWLSRR